MRSQSLSRCRWLVAAAVLGTACSGGCIQDNWILTWTADFLTYLVVGTVSSAL